MEEGHVVLPADYADYLIPKKGPRISRITRILDSEISANSEKDEKLSDD
jgi:hypothetical protein